MDSWEHGVLLAGMNKSAASVHLPEKLGARSLTLRPWGRCADLRCCLGGLLGRGQDERAQSQRVLMLGGPHSISPSSSQT